MAEMSRGSTRCAKRLRHGIKEERIHPTKVRHHSNRRARISTSLGYGNDQLLAHLNTHARTSRHGDYDYKRLNPKYISPNTDDEAQYNLPTGTGSPFVHLSRQGYED